MASRRIQESGLRSIEGERELAQGSAARPDVDDADCATRELSTDAEREGRLVIAHVLRSLQVGGAEQLTLELAAAQRAEGHHVFVVSLSTPPHGPLAHDFRARGIDLQVVHKAARFDLSLPPRLAVLLAKRGVDVVHTHNPQPLVYGALAARLARAAAVHTKHGINQDLDRRLWLRRGASRFTHAFVAVSEATARFAVTSGEALADRLHVIPNGVDLRRFYPDDTARDAVRRELGLPEDAWVIGTVGRLVEDKNHALLLEAAAALPCAQAHVVLVGAGPLERPLRARASHLGIADRVTFAGLRRDIPRLLAAFDAFALPSNTEGLPLVLLEAMACALPIVATAVGGIPSVIDDGTTGLLVPPADVDALCARLQDLFERPAAARNLGRRARQAALTRHSVQRMSRQYLRLYRMVLSARAPASKR